MTITYDKLNPIERFFTSQNPWARAVRRPWTPVVDFFTGVIERKEISCYDSGILMSWIKGATKVKFKDAAGYGAQRYLVEGTEREIFDNIYAVLEKRDSNMVNTTDAYGMQSLRRRDGMIMITVNRPGLTLS